MTDTSKQKAPPQTAREMILKYFRDFGVLKDTRKEYWGVQIVNILDCTFYFGMLTIASLFLSHDLGLSDKAAGHTIALFTSVVIVMLTVSGMFCDWLGIRVSLRLSMWSLLFLRLAVVGVAMMPSLPNRGFIVGALFLAMAPFTAAIQTIFQAATQRFTTRRSRSAGFNLWYLFMNIGAAAGAYSIDLVRLQLHVANVHIFTMGVATAALCLVFGEWLIRNESQLRGADEGPETAADKPVHKSPLAIMKDVVHEPALARLLVLIALILGVRAVYTYLYLLMPKYWERTIGPNAAIGVLSMINPVGIVIGLILFIPLANKFKVFNMLVFGAMISSLSLFPMALPWRSYGLDIGQAHYLMAVLCMVLLTVGEVLWSPKLYEYTAAIAPKGQEGTYLGLSMIPWFLAKTLVSWFSGNMLEHWSPETVKVGTTAMPLQQAMIEGRLGYWHTPAAMWFWLGLYALVGCAIAGFLRNWLTRGARFTGAPATAAASEAADQPV